MYVNDVQLRLRNYLKCVYFFAICSLLLFVLFIGFLFCCVFVCLCVCVFLFCFCCFFGGVLVLGGCWGGVSFSFFSNNNNINI